MTNVNWWPYLLRHIPDERPWERDPVVVAEIRSFNEGAISGYRSTISVLVPLEEVKAAQASLTAFDHEVSTSGPRPSPSASTPYQPRFWVEARGLPREKYEPLVLTWTSHDKTVLVPDPGFLMTYGLVPRAIRDSKVLWDDPATPVHDVVVVDTPSTWDFPNATPSSVSIKRDYLQDYLTLRNVALVQLYYEKRIGAEDADIEGRLAGEEAVEVRFSDRLIALNRYLPDRKTVVTQVWGGRIVASPGPIPVSGRPLEQKGLRWPGFELPVTSAVAARLAGMQWIYVDDRVLAKFEGERGFRVYPESGAVSFGTQWSVGYCDRVGRDLIRLELKKLYEGAPPHIIKHWNDFAVEPPPRSAYPAILRERNIAKRARDLVYASTSLGGALTALAKALGEEKSPESYVGLSRAALDYKGWWSSPETAAAAWHAPLNMTADTFLRRCATLNKLLVESLSEGPLRDLLIGLGIPQDDIKTYRSLKLLDLVIRLGQIAGKTGLRLASDGKEIYERLKKDGTEPSEPIALLFALNDIRQLEAHRASERSKELTQELERFGIAPGEERAGYGKILDRIYDGLAAQLTEVVARLGRR